MRPAHLALTLPALLLGLVPLTVAAQEFRVETDIYVAKQEEPVAESLTIFAGDYVYDFLLGESGEITIFDIRRGRLVLLHPHRKIQTTLTTENLLELCEAIKARAANEGQYELFSPRFETSFDDASQRLTLTSAAISYTARGQTPKQPEAAKKFQQFADWYSRLNAIRPGNMPPFGRLELNQALLERNLIPLEIERTVTTKRAVGDRQTVVRSKHLVTWLISSTDRKRMETAGTYLTSFQEVGGREYWQADVAALSKKD